MVSVAMAWWHENSLLFVQYSNFDWIFKALWPFKRIIALFILSKLYETFSSSQMETWERNKLFLWDKSCLGNYLKETLALKFDQKVVFFFFGLHHFFRPPPESLFSLLSVCNRKISHKQVKFFTWNCTQQSIYLTGSSLLVISVTTLNVLDDKFSYTKSPNIWWPLGYFKNIIIKVKMDVATFWQLLGKICLLFIATSGHTAGYSHKHNVLCRLQT